MIKDIERVAYKVNKAGGMIQSRAIFYLILLALEEQDKGLTANNWLRYVNKDD